MTRYDLGLAWNWEYDADFVSLLDKACRSQNLSLLEIRPDNLAAALDALARQEVDFGAFLDRASESDIRFLPLVDWAAAHPVFLLNPHERAVRAMNKACMHLEFITAGIHTPYTIILPPWNEKPEPGALDLGPLGERFIIKPAHGGGGEGVIHEASSLAQVLAARRAFPHDHYLLQAKVEPAELDGRPAWFRVIYCGGEIHPCWWSPRTHEYLPVTGEEEKAFELAALYSTSLKIARVCGLDIFSTEIARVASGLFVAVDYVNHPIDLRLQSATPDGVPDSLVLRIAGRIAGIVHERVFPL
jgi:hypothetical protein